MCGIVALTSYLSKQVQMSRANTAGLALEHCEIIIIKSDSSYKTSRHTGVVVTVWRES